MFYEYFRLWRRIVSKVKQVAIQISVLVLNLQKFKRETNIIRKPKCTSFDEYFSNNSDEFKVKHITRCTECYAVINESVVNLLPLKWLSIDDNCLSNFSLKSYTICGIFLSYFIRMFQKNHIIFLEKSESLRYHQKYQDNSKIETKICWIAELHSICLVALKLCGNKCATITSIPFHKDEIMNFWSIHLTDNFSCKKKTGIHTFGKH